MSVITISREFASEGTYIAQQAAQALGYYLVEKNTLEKILSQYGFVQFGEEYESAPSYWERLDTNRINMIEMLNRVVRAIAQHGNVVILGRGSFAVLAGFADVLNIRIQAPLTYRVKRVMEKQAITDPVEAEAVVKESDRVRSSFIHSWYGVDWDTTSHFDLVVDTSKVPPHLAVSMILEANKALQERPNDNTPTCSTIEVDSILAGVVNEVLGSTSPHA